MRTSIARMVLGIGGMLGIASIPAYCDTTLLFNIVTGGGSATYTPTGGSFQISQIVLSGGGTITLDSSDYLTLSWTCTSTMNNCGNPSSLTISQAASPDGSDPFSTISGGTALYTASTSVTNLSITGAENPGRGGSLSVTASDTTTVALNSTFYTDLVSDLNITGTNQFTLAGGITGSNGSIVSDTIGLTALPEPSSVFLFGTGLLALAAACAAKRRFRPSIPNIGVETTRVEMTLGESDSSGAK